MELSPRLSTIVSLLNLPTKVADIGTDHAYLPIYLARETNCPTIIAADCNLQPYQAAVNHVQEAGVADKVDVRCGFGLSVLEENEVDTVIIAGLGSKTIRGIIKSNYELAQNLEQIILQPMAGAGSLRQWLVKNKFKIINEVLVKEGKLYQILVIKPGIMEVKDDFLLEVGPLLIKNKGQLLTEHYSNLKDKWKRIIANISKKDPSHPKVQELKNKIHKLEQLKKNN